HGQARQNSPTIVASAKTTDNNAYTSATSTNQDVTVHFTCTDGTGSGVVTCPADVTFTASGFSSAVTVQDAAGNTSSPANQITINIDKVAPTVTLAQPANGSVSNNTTPTFSGMAGTATGD